MNIVSQKREFALQNNTAQAYLEKALNTLSPTGKLLVIVKDQARPSDSTPASGMDGILDFGILEERGFRSIERIEIQPHGGVTELIRLPPTLRVLDATHQLLTGVENLPSSLEELNLGGNYLERLDLANLPKLKKLVVSNNRLLELTNMPLSLEYMDINHNPIRSLDVTPLVRLKTLLCTSDHLKRVKNVTPTIKKLETNSAVTQIEYGNVPIEPKEAKLHANEVEYEEALRDYFRLKNKYEHDAHADRAKAFARGTSTRRKQKLAKAVIPKCVKCARRVGSIFQHKDYRYVALCGDKTKPCDLKIKLFSGYYHELDAMLRLFKEELDEHKETIIKQKLDTIFGFLSENQSVELFKNIMDHYTKDSAVYKELLDQHTDLYESPHREGLIRAKMAQVTDLQKSIQTILEGYLQSGDTKILQTAVHQYVHELMPEMENLRHLKYEHMDVYPAIGQQSMDPFPEVYLFCSERALSKREVIPA